MKLITDSGSMMSQQQAAALNIRLLPLQVAINGRNYRDYFDLSAQDFVEMVKSAIPASSQPAIGEVMEAYEQVDEGLHITMTKGLSSTYDSALGIISGNNIKHIRLFNSRTLAGTQQYLVELAARLINRIPVDEIIARMETCLSECQSFLIPSDFDYLKRGGRLSPLAATLSGLIKLKPIVTQVEGSERLEKLGFGRTWSQAIDRIIEKMLQNGVDQRHIVYISHAFNAEVAANAMQAIKAKFHDIEVIILELTPVMITQGGPGCVSVQYILKDNN